MVAIELAGMIVRDSTYSSSQIVLRLLPIICYSRLGKVD